MSQGLPAPTRYIPALDGLRAVAVTLVVLSHLGVEMLPGGFGVTLFFWISGYLLTGQMLAEHAQSGRIDLRRFYLRRALRLLPAALVFLLLAGGSFALAGGHVSAAGWLSAVFYGANYYDLYAGYRTTLPGVRHPLIILWSLAVEEHFYLIWPRLLLILLRRERAGAVLVGVCLVELLWRAWLFHACAGADMSLCGVRPLDRAYKATDARLDSIAWGALVAVLAALRPVLVTRLARDRCALAVSFLLLLAAFVLRDPWFRQVIRFSLQGLALSVLIPAMLMLRGPARRLLELPAALFVGRLSYGIYLWHWASLAMADAAARPGSAAWLAVAVALTCALSLASWHLIERPMLRLRRRAGSHAPDAVLRVQPTAAMALPLPP